MPGFAPPHPQQTQQDGHKVQHLQAGIWWPAADSARLRAAAHAWREMATALDGVFAATQASAQSVQADNQGKAVDAFEAYWQKWAGSNGYLPAASAASLAMAKALEQYAQAVDDARRKVEELVAEVATAVVIGIALSVLTVGISDAAAGAVSAGLIASAAMVGVDLTAVAGTIATIIVGATVGAVEAMAIDVVAIQPEKILVFHDQKDFSWSEVLQWGEMGAAGGFFGGGASAVLRAGSDVMPESISAALDTRLGQMAAGSLVGAGSSAVLDEIQYGEINPLDVAAGTVGGLAGGGLSYRVRWQTELTSRANTDLSEVGSDVHPNVPPYTDPPAMGVLSVDGVEVPLRSGEQGPGRWLYDNLPHGEGSGMTRAWTHVEGHTAGIMRELNIKDADLYINKPPCGEGSAKCRFVLYKLLPEGSTLRIHFPGDDGTVQVWTFRGGVPRWQE